MLKAIELEKERTVQLKLIGLFTSSTLRSESPKAYDMKLLIYPAISISFYGTVFYGMAFYGMIFYGMANSSTIIDI